MRKNSKIKKGGSRASNAVMALKPALCMDYSSPVIEGKYIDYDINDLSLYRTTGGGRKSGISPPRLLLRPGDLSPA